LLQEPERCAAEAPAPYHDKRNEVTGEGCGGVVVGKTCKIRRILRALAQGCLLGGQILADSEGGDILSEKLAWGDLLIAHMGKLTAGDLTPAF